jgi:hypothetical protein
VIKKDRQSNDEEMLDHKKFHMEQDAIPNFLKYGGKSRSDEFVEEETVNKDKLLLQHEKTLNNQEKLIERM